MLSSILQPIENKRLSRKKKNGGDGDDADVAESRTRTRSLSFAEMIDAARNNDEEDSKVPESGTVVESKEQEDTEVSTKEQEEEEEKKKKDRLVVPIISAPSLRRFVMTLSLEEVTEGAFVLAMSSVESLCVDCDANANVLKLATLQLVGSLVKSSLQNLNSVSSLLDVVVKQFQTSSISSGGNVGAFTELNDALLVPSPREMKLRHAIKTLSALCSTSSMDWDKHVSNFKLSKLFDKLDGCLKSLDIISSSSLFQGKKRKIEKKSSKKKRKRSEVESLETPSSSRSSSRAQKAASPASVSKPSNTLGSPLYDI